MASSFVAMRPRWLSTSRWSVIGLFIGWGLFGLAGFVVGIHVYPPTSPFAAVELGIPGSLACGIVGAALGLVRDLYVLVRGDDERRDRSAPP